MIGLKTSDGHTECTVTGDPIKAITDAMVAVNAMYVSLAEFGEDTADAFRVWLEKDVASGEVFRYHKEDA